MVTPFIQKIIFSEGSQLELPELTVLIGPNNSGKSRTLKELLEQVTRPYSATGPILDTVDYYVPDSFDEAINHFKKFVHYSQPQDQLCFKTIAPELDRQHIGHVGQSLETEKIKYTQLSPDKKRQHFASVFGPALTLYLGTEQRISLTNENSSAAHDHEESNILQSLYNRPSSFEEKIQIQVLEAFSKHVKLDYSVPQKLCFRVADNMEDIPSDPRDARPILAKHLKIDDQGDGLRSYLGLVTALLTTDRRLVLIDEPEAFLHPPQAYRMGMFITELLDNSKQIVVATHSPDILKGLLNKKGNTKILRIEQRAKKNILKEVPVSELKKIVSDPLLGSSRVLEGLFATATIVVEADADARFYQTILRKLEPKLDIQCIVADNKQTVSKILALYKKLGVRSIGIIDIDLLSVATELKNTCNDIELDTSKQTKVMEAQKVIAYEIEKKDPSDSATAVLDRHIHLENHAESLREHIKEGSIDNLREDLTKYSSEARRAADAGKPWKEIKKKGIDILSDEAKSNFNIIDSTLRKNDVFLNPCGELEASLVEFGLKYSTHKKDWFINAMKLLDGINLQGDKKIVQFISDIVNSLK